ncbi:MAG: NAD-dependent epimerase/dehydratase family protein [Myxococcota bacterium]|nr:NAD-dependent epimerase/dehydratase family protein [Myxococcota bacterium]
MKVLVLGGAGFLGFNAVEALRDAGLDVVAGHRRRTNTILLRRREVPRVQADLDNLESLREAMRDVDVVVHAAGYYPRFSVSPERAIATGMDQSERVLDAAATAGVRRVIYLSSTGTVAPTPGGTPSTERDVWTQAPEFGVYHALKWRMEQRFLAEQRFEVAVLCPGACLGPWDLRIGTSALLVATAGGLRPPHPDGWVNLVDVRDVARGVVACCAAPATVPRLLLSGHSLRLQPLLESLSTRYGVAPPSLPLSPKRAIALADEAEAEALRTAGRARLSREIVDLINHGVPIDASRAAFALNLSWTPLDRTLEAFETFARRMRFIPPEPLRGAPFYQL